MNNGITTMDMTIVIFSFIYFITNMAQHSLSYLLMALLLIICSACNSTHRNIENDTFASVACMLGHGVLSRMGISN